MARIYGFVSGVVAGLSAAYLTARQFRLNSEKVRGELQLSSNFALGRPVLTRPYTDPIDLETRNWKDTVTDMWNDEVIRGVNWLYSLTKA